jgi:hypothetical protein
LCTQTSVFFFIKTLSMPCKRNISDCATHHYSFLLKCCQRPLKRYRKCRFERANSSTSSVLPAQVRASPETENRFLLLTLNIPTVDMWRTGKNYYYYYLYFYECIVFEVLVNVFILRKKIVFFFNNFFFLIHFISLFPLVHIC